MVNSDIKHELTILEHIEENPDASQAALAAQIGVAVGTINWYLKRMIAKGYVKANRMERRKLRYIITPEGLALRARLTIDYLQTSFEMYRLVRERMSALLKNLQQQGIKKIKLEGEGDVADICRLTCLEKGFSVVTIGYEKIVKVHGLKVFTVDDLSHSTESQA